jgi:hypothetical protein
VIKLINLLVLHHTFFTSWENISCSRKTTQRTASTAKHTMLWWNRTTAYQTLNAAPHLHQSCCNMCTKRNTLSTSKCFYITFGRTKKKVTRLWTANEWSYTCTPPHAFMQCMGITLPLLKWDSCCTHFISSMVALFIGSICNIWHSMLTTDLFRYSGMGKIPAITTVNSCHLLTEATKAPQTYSEIRTACYCFMLANCISFPYSLGAITCSQYQTCIF